MHENHQNSARDLQNTLFLTSMLAYSPHSQSMSTKPPMYSQCPIYPRLKPCPTPAASRLKKRRPLSNLQTLPSARRLHMRSRSCTINHLAKYPSVVESCWLASFPSMKERKSDELSRPHSRRQCSAMFKDYRARAGHLRPSAPRVSYPVTDFIFRWSPKPVASSSV